MTVETDIPSLPFSWLPRNNMLICSLASGTDHLAMMQVMAPTVEYYAKKHNMDSLLIPMPGRRLEESRPPAWDKVILIHHALTMYDTVMWIDADAIICNPTKDIRKSLDPESPIHLVAHRLKDKMVPNTGVWVCRKEERAFELLKKIWNHREFINHRWWEQAALMDLIGYEPRDLSSVFRGPTPYSSYIRFLGEEWNSRRVNPADDPVIIHFLGKNKKMNEFHKRYKEFLSYVQ